ncbi:hypothetical protein MMC30_004552 [Trapelia coarctata]|nr:hypothetical protein [Trapelia coarctata]
MSFNAKNLTYESKEPSFLRKLKSEYGGNNSGRHERPLARPRKQKGADEDEDDEPTYVVDGGRDTLTKAEYDALMNPQDEAVSQAKGVRDGEATESANGSAESTRIATDQAEDLPQPAKKEVVATIGGTGKRRIAKVVGDDPEGDEGKEDRKPAASAKKAAKPKKKVKLSFDEEG